MGSDRDAAQSNTVSYMPAARQPEHSQEPSAVDANDKTIISQRPVAAPEEFYRSMPLAELAAMLEGKQLDHFAVEQMIGGGGMGAVFRGRDERLDRTVAIKVIPAAKRDPETLRRFRLEAQAAARLDHPNIARVYYVGEAEQWNYIVFEFIDGVNVRDLVSMEGPLSVDDAVFYTRQVAEALEHAHEREVVHRDVKPSNILVTASGIAKVVDMGLARDTSMDKSNADATASGVTLGTFDYISPEQARNPRDADVRSDLYSLGCSLFFMLTGHPPFPEGTALQKLLNHGSQPPPDPRGWRDDLSDQLYAIMMKLMAKQPSARYQKPSELINDLMLLAEVEGLARSQAPGTLLMTPSVAQRSLLESNLPWLVGFAFLLGSTLWLQSVQAISGGYRLPELNLESRRALRSTNDNGLSGDSPNASNTGTGNASSSGASPGSSLPSRMLPGSLEPAGTTPESSPLRANETNTTDANARTPLTRDTGIGSEVLPPSPRDSTTSNSLGTSAGEASVSVEPARNSPMTVPTQAPPRDATSGMLESGMSGPIVVSSFQPLGIDQSLWERNLRTAVDRAIVEGRSEIEIYGEVLLEEPLNINAATLTIRGENSRRAKIEIAASVVSEARGWPAAIALQDSNLRFVGLELSCQAQNTVLIRDGALVLSSGDSTVRFSNCELTVATESTNPSAFFVLVNDETITQSWPFDPRTESIAAQKSTSLFSTFENTIVRSDASLMAVRVGENSASRVEISFTNTLVAAAGLGIQLKQLADSFDQTSRSVRVFSEQSTFVTRSGFALVEQNNDDGANVTLNRTSNKCIFSASAKTPHLTLLGGSDATGITAFLLKGIDNAYDRDTQFLLQAMRGGDNTSGPSTGTKITFSQALQDGWLAERGNEQQVRWLQPPPNQLKLSNATPADFEVEKGMFSPGFRIEESLFPL